MKVKVIHFIAGKWVTNLTYKKYEKQGMDLSHRYWKNFPKNKLNG